MRKNSKRNFRKIRLKIGVLRIIQTITKEIKEAEAFSTFSGLDETLFLKKSILSVTFNLFTCMITS